MRIFPIIRKVTTVIVGGSGGVSNTRSIVNPAIAVSQRFSQVGTFVTVGLSTLANVVSFRSPQNPACTIVQRVSGTPLVADNVALDIDQRFAESGTVDNLAANLVQVTYALAHRRGATAVTNIGAFAWANPTNAQAENNGTTATMAGDTINARNGVLRFDYANLTGKTELVITNVTLRFYVSSTGTVAANGSLALLYRTDGVTTLGGTTLETITGDVALAARSFDITAAIAGSWTAIENLTCFVQGITDVAEGLINYAVDAVVVEITASVTDLL